MIRRAFMVVVWLSIGYFVGFDDARVHERTVVARSMDRVRIMAGEVVKRQRAALEESAKDMLEAASGEVRHLRQGAPAAEREDPGDSEVAGDPDGSRIADPGPGDLPVEASEGGADSPEGDG